MKTPLLGDGKGNLFKEFKSVQKCIFVSVCVCGGLGTYRCLSADDDDLLLSQSAGRERSRSLLKHRCWFSTWWGWMVGRARLRDQAFPPWLDRPIGDLPTLTKPRGGIYAPLEWEPRGPERAPWKLWSTDQSNWWSLTIRRSKPAPPRLRKLGRRASDLAVKRRA